jgi:hypothetical protein
MKPYPNNQNQAGGQYSRLLRYPTFLRRGCRLTRYAIKFSLNYFDTAFHLAWIAAIEEMVDEGLLEKVPSTKMSRLMYGPRYREYRSTGPKHHELYGSGDERYELECLT